MDGSRTFEAGTGTGLYVGGEMSEADVVGVASGDGTILDAFVGDAVFGDGWLGAGAGAGSGAGFGTKFNAGTGLFVGSTPPP